MTIQIRPGVRVLTLHGEEDTDGEQQRRTEPGTWGRIAALNHVDETRESNWDVLFPNGCKVIITSAELIDAASYVLAEPANSEQQAPHP